MYPTPHYLLLLSSCAPFFPSLSPYQHTLPYLPPPPSLFCPLLSILHSRATYYPINFLCTYIIVFSLITIGFQILLSYLPLLLSSYFRSRATCYPTIFHSPSLMFPSLVMDRSNPYHCATMWLWPHPYIPNLFYSPLGIFCSSSTSLYTLFSRVMPSPIISIFFQSCHVPFLEFS